MHEPTAWPSTREQIQQIQRRNPRKKRQDSVGRAIYAAQIQQITRKTPGKILAESSGRCKNAGKIALFNEAINLRSSGQRWPPRNPMSWSGRGKGPPHPGALRLPRGGPGQALFIIFSHSLFAFSV